MRINTNILSLSAQRNLGNTTRALSRAMERLASGLRINSARDDAAGMAIGTGLDAQRRGMVQAVRNINDARGFLNTAEGAMTTQSDLVQRMRELSIQAANGTLSDDDRKYLNAELQQLLEEFNRITRQTQFNGVNLLDGSFTTKGLQVGATKGSTIDFSIASMAASSVFYQRVTVGDGTFQTAESLASGSTPYSVETADLNGDGNLDLVSTSYNDNSVSVFIGNGDGTFQSRSTIAVSGTPLFVTTADLNGDGNIDLVVTDDGGPGVILGNGDGTFQARVAVDGGAFITATDVGDFNSDGVFDLIVTNLIDHTASILIGNGNGTFQTRTTMGSGLFPSYVLSADVNEDGHLDLLTLDGDNTASIVLGNGNGTFQVRSTISIGSGPFMGTTADLNEDGHLDLITTESGNAVSVAFGNGNGTFQARTTIQVGLTPLGVSVYDMNGDGNMDLLTADFDDNTVSLLLGNGDGTFKSRSTMTPGDLPIFVAVGDLNGDEVPDIATADFGIGDTNSILIGNSVSIVRNPAVTITTQASAENMLEVFDNALNYISSARASIGATTSRLDFAQAVSESLVENLSFAKSQIMDADVSAEVAEFSRLQILQQAGVSVLSQANLSTQLALKLLENI